MKKLIFRVVVSIATFLIGLGVFIFVFLYFNSIPDIPAPLSPVQKNEECAESKSFPGISQKVSDLKKGKSGYFPKDKFSAKWEKEDDFVNDWYGEQLKAMSEKSLLTGADENTEIYRFLWLRTFNHPIFVRLERSQDKVKLFTKELDGAGGYKPGKIIRSNELNVKQADFCEFLTLLEKANFWNLATKDDVLGEDGAQWVLEGVRGGRYHVVDRWTPERGEFREACIYLLKLSGVDTDRLKDDLY